MNQGALELQDKRSLFTKHDDSESVCLCDTRQKDKLCMNARTPVNSKGVSLAGTA